MTTKQLYRITVAIAALTAAGVPLAQAQSSDALIEKLVDKGVLTQQEAKDLRDEVDKDFTKAYASKSGMPEWVTALKFNGDFRGRYESFYYSNEDAKVQAICAAVHTPEVVAAYKAAVEAALAQYVQS